MPPEAVLDAAAARSSPPPFAVRCPYVSVVYRPRPLMDGQDVERFELEPGETFAAIVARVVPDRAAWDRLVVSVDDDLVPRACWDLARPKAGTRTVITPLPANGRQALTAVLLIAVAVAAVYTGGAAASLAGGPLTLTGAAAGAAASTAIPLAGALATGPLAPPPA